MNFFNPDSPVMRFLSRLFDLIVLNFLFIICCLPIFTIGASITAMYSITLKMVRNEECYIVRAFFSSFKKNFKTATLLWIPIFFIGLFFCADLYIIHNHLDPSFYFLRYPVMCMIIILCCGYLYLFPLLSFYENSTKQLIKNAFLLSLGHLPTTIIVLCLHIFVLIVATSNYQLGIILFSLYLFCGFAAMALLYSSYYRKVFDLHTPEEETAEQSKEATVYLDDENE